MYSFLSSREIPVLKHSTVTQLIYLHLHFAIARVAIIEMGFVVLGRVIDRLFICSAFLESGLSFLEV